MAATVEELTEQALDLSEEKRAELAHRILLSLEDAIDEGVQEAWDTEITRRVASIRAGTARGRPAEEVFRDIRAKHQ